MLALQTVSTNSHFSSLFSLAPSADNPHHFLMCRNTAYVSTHFPLVPENILRLLVTDCAINLPNIPARRSHPPFSLIKNRTWPPKGEGSNLNCWSHNNQWPPPPYPCWHNRQSCHNLPPRRACRKTRCRGYTDQTPRTYRPPFKGCRSHGPDRGRRLQYYRCNDYCPQEPHSYWRLIFRKKQYYRRNRPQHTDYKPATSVKCFIRWRGHFRRRTTWSRLFYLS